MKKSEFEKSRLEHWRAEFIREPHVQTGRDVEAAEAAGVVWDPEEPELPARLYLANADTLEPVVVADMKLKPWIFKVARGADPDIPERAAIRKRVALEAVRRYNAWPELRALVVEHLNNVRQAGLVPARWNEQLLAILDGEPT